MPIVNEDIRLKLKPEERKRLSAEIQSRIQSARSGMREMLDRLKDWDDQYEGVLPEKNFPWPDCSNIHIPLTQWHVDTYKAHVNDVVLGVDPIILVMPPAGMNDEPESKDLAGRIQDFLSYQFEQMDLPEMLEQDFIPSCLRNPAGIIKNAWREEYRTIRKLMPMVDEMTGQPMIDEMGQPVMQVVEETEPKYRGVRNEYVDLRNFVIWPLTAKSIEDAVMVGDSFRLTPQQVKERVKSKEFDSVAKDIPAEGEAGSDIDSETVEQDDYEGIEKLGDFEQLRFWQVIYPYDANGDGVEEDCVFTIEHNSGTIVRATKYPYYHGRRFYVAASPWARPGKLMGRCIPQILEGLQDEINAIHNQRSDAITLAMTKCFTFLKSSGIDIDTLIVSPGSGIPVETQDDIREFNFSPLVPGADAEQISRDYAERATSINDVSLGRQTEGDKTAHEVAVVNSASGIRFSDVIRPIQKAVAEISKQVLWLCYQFCEDEEISRFGLTRDMLIVPWEIVPHGNTGTANKVQQRQEGMMLYDKLMQNPLVAMDIRRMYHATQNMLQAFDRRDVENWIGTPDEAEQIFATNLAAQEAQIQQAQMMEAMSGAIGGLAQPGAAMGGAGIPGAGTNGAGVQG